MENASKALMMAGGVLISLLVISLLVFFYNNLKDLQNIDQTVEETEQAIEFNKQYDVYARNIYGSDILSIANKIEDYNKRESENKGYTKIELSVTIEKDIDSEFFRKGIYSSSNIVNKIEQVEKKANEIGNKTVKSIDGIYSRKVSKLATMRTIDIEALGISMSSCNELITQYNTYKTLVTEIKAKVFTYINFDYDDNTGRIKKMNYKL